MIKECTFLTSLSDIDHDFDESSSSSSDEEHEISDEDKLNGLCFLVDTAGGLCTMALGEDEVGGNDKDIDDDSTSEVSRSADDLVTEVDERTTTLAFWDKSRGKVVSHGTIRVNESFLLKDVALVSNLHSNLHCFATP
jgi:hypothetical protein